MLVMVSHLRSVEAREVSLQCKASPGGEALPHAVNHDMLTINSIKPGFLIVFAGGPICCRV